MAYSPINKSTANVNTKLYTGTAATHALTGVGHQPDFLWIKNRQDTSHNHVNDSVYGANKWRYTDLTQIDDTANANITYGTDGITFNGGNYDQNASGKQYVMWSWKANGSGSSNTDGDITTTCSANTTNGFSIIKWTGNGNASQTLGHGLGVKPSLFICKRTSGSDNWQVFMDSTKNGTSDVRMLLSSQDGNFGNYPVTFNTTTITTPNPSDNAWNNTGDTYVGYVWAEKTGYSRFAKYSGNGESSFDNCPFIYTGFRPSIIIIKNDSETSRNWLMFDNKREGYNPENDFLYPNRTNSEDNGNGWLHMMSNGFKIRDSGNDLNQNTATYTFYAWGQPIVSNGGVPCTAR